MADCVQIVVRCAREHAGGPLLRRSRRQSGRLAAWSACAVDAASSLYNTCRRALASPEDSSERALARSALARRLRMWGCSKAPTSGSVWNIATLPPSWKSWNPGVSRAGVRFLHPLHRLDEGARRAHAHGAAARGEATAPPRSVLAMSMRKQSGASHARRSLGVAQRLVEVVA